MTGTTGESPADTTGDSDGSAPTGLHLPSFNDAWWIALLAFRQETRYVVVQDSRYRETLIRNAGRARRTVFESQLVRQECDYPYQFHDFTSCPRCHGIRAQRAAAGWDPYAPQTPADVFVPPRRVWPDEQAPQRIEIASFDQGWWTALLCLLGRDEELNVAVDRAGVSRAWILDLDLALPRHERAVQDSCHDFVSCPSCQRIRGPVPLGPDGWRVWPPVRT